MIPLDIHKDSHNLKNWKNFTSTGKAVEKLEPANNADGNVK